MCGDLGALGQEARKLEGAGVDSIHVDIMDGHFVPNLVFGRGVVAALRPMTSLPLHVHMMVSNPTDQVRPFAEPGAELYYYFHLESEPHPPRLAAAVTESGMTPGVAINPFTPLATVVDLPMSYVLVTSVEPGFAGRRWIPHTTRRLRELRASLGNDVTLGVDGKVTKDNSVLAYEHRASLFVCGSSSIYCREDYDGAIGEMRESLRAAQHLQSHNGAPGGE